MNKRRGNLKRMTAGWTLLIIVLLVVLSGYSLGSLSNHLASTEIMAYTDIAEMRVQMMEDEFKKIRNDLIKISTNDTSLDELRKDLSMSEYAFYKLQLLDQYKARVENYRYVSGLYMYDITRQQFFSYYIGNNYRESQDVRNSAFLKDIVKNEKKTYTGSIEVIDGTAYYITSLYADGFYIGGWYGIDELEQFILSGEYPYTGGRQELGGNMYQCGDCSSRYVVGITGESSGIRYYFHISGNHLLKAIWRTMVTYVLVIIAISMLLFFSMRRLVYKVTSPIHYMKNELMQISNEDPDRRLTREESLEEFNSLYSTFNQMADRLYEMNRQVLKEQAERQKIYESYLILQMNPHFYVNSLNIINGLARIKNYALIEELTDELSDYLNYMFRADTTEVAMKDEIRHIENYIRIQQIRYAADFSCDIRMDEELMKIQIPRLLLHTFVENSVKHASSDLAGLRISVTGECEDGKARILIRDNGKGFSEELLGYINERVPVVKQDGEHIGIWNLEERFLHYYEGEGSIRCFNSDGAAVEILIPLGDR